MTGQTASTNFPTSDAYQGSLVGNTDVFVSKFSPDGSSLVSSTYFGAGALDSEYGYGIAVDAAGSAYIAGSTDVTDLPTTTGAFQTSNGGGVDAFVTKLSPAGNALVYSTYLGGSGPDGAQAIAVDAAGAAYVAGTTQSTDFDTTAGAHQSSRSGSQDVFVTKLKPDGSGLAWSTYLGGTGSEDGYAVAVDVQGRAYVTGSTTSSDFDTTAGAHDTSLGGGQDAFVTGPSWWRWT